MDGWDAMYKNKAPDGSNNICGKRIKKFREQLPEKLRKSSFPICCRLPGWM